LACNFYATDDTSADLGYHLAMPFKYQIALLGRFASHRARFERTFFVKTDELGIDRSHIAIVEERNSGAIDLKAPLVAVFFGYDGADDASHPQLSALLANSNTIITCVDADSSVAHNLPASVSHINAFFSRYDDADWERIVSLILENLRLLRSERRLFISYKRSESQSVAVQLYECFGKAGFDVFLDTRSVPYGVNFQSILWHRMADSDVVVLLDTPNFRGSHWTQQELSQANATNIQILHLLWPGIKADDASAFSEFVPLLKSNFRGHGFIGERARLNAATSNKIISKAESLRARALAARHRSLVDNFCDRAKDAKVLSLVVQPERYISVERRKGEKVAVVPTIGVPRADRYQEIEVAHCTRLVIESAKRAMA
jgi:hypothetical protein